MVVEALSPAESVTVILISPMAPPALYVRFAMVPMPWVFVLEYRATADSS